MTEREKRQEFNQWVRKARAAWLRGAAVVIMPFKEYLRLDAAAEREKRRKGRG